MRRALAALLSAVLLASIAPRAEAAPPPDPAAEADAKVHFDRGVALFKDQAWDGALAEFLTSRQIFDTRSATKNAAICLRKLHRFDESLALFEALLKEFSDLSDDEKAVAQANIADLLPLVGALELTDVEAGAAIAIDGQPRGTTPLQAPLRVSVGTHVVRVSKEGYLPFEARLDIAGGQSRKLSAPLSSLVQSGRIRVIERSGKPSEVVIDGVVAGKTPYDGALPIGDHVLLLEGGNGAGTQPVNVSVRLHESTELTLTDEPLDAHLRVVPSPAGATVSIDGVRVGAGTWDGRLRAGAHRVDVTAEGFAAAGDDLTLAPGDRLYEVALQHGSKASSFVTLEVQGGAAILPSFGGPVGGSGGASVGPVFVLRAAYQLALGLNLGATIGYLRLSEQVANRATTIQPVGLAPDAGAATDALARSGVLLGASAGYRIQAKFPIEVRLGGGAMLGSMTDVRSASFNTTPRTGHPTTPYALTDIATRASTPIGYVAPEARIGYRFAKRFEASLGAALFVMISPSPPTWDASKVVLAGADGNATFKADPLSSSVFVAIVPSLGLRVDL